MFTYRCPKCGATTGSCSPNAVGSCLHGKPSGRNNPPVEMVLVTKKK